MRAKNQTVAKIYYTVGMMLSFALYLSTVDISRANQESGTSSDLSKELQQIIQNMQAGKPLEQQKILALRERGQQPLTILNTWLNDDNVAVEKRWFSAILMARIGSPEARLRLTQALKAKAFIARMAAIKGFEILGDDSTLPSIHRLLNKDQAMVVRAAAADTIGNFAVRSSLPHLTTALRASNNFHRNKSLWVRKHIIEAIGKLGGKESLPSLIQCLKESEEDIQQTALQALNPMDSGSPNVSSLRGKWLAWWNREPTNTPEQLTPGN